MRARQATESAVMLDTAGQPSRLGLTPKPTGARGNVAHLERRRLRRRDASGRTRTVVHHKVRYRDATGKHHSETKTGLIDAERRRLRLKSRSRPQRGEILGAVSYVLPNGRIAGCPADLIFGQPLGQGSKRQ